MDRQTLCDNILGWKILGDCLNCGILIPEAMPAVEAECSNKTLVKDVFGALNKHQGQIPFDWNPELLAPSTAAFLQVASMTTMWDSSLLAASDLLLRRFFSKDQSRLEDYYAGTLLHHGFPAGQIKQILKLEFNSDVQVQGEYDLDALRESLPLPKIKPNAKILFYQELQKRLALGEGLFASIQVAAGSNRSWITLFESLNQSEEALGLAMQQAGHKPLEQVIILSGLKSGNLDHSLISLIQALETIERLS